MNEQQDVSPDADANGGGAQRQRSSISFPYNDFNDAAAIAEKIQGNVGNGDCSLQQLSAWLDQSNKSSGFRIQIAAARLFGLIESEGTDSYRLTPLGRRLADPNSLRKAKAEAFLNVPLFKALHENHKDGVLPPAAALEREIAGLGVAEKQKDRARQVFERSAEQTGFFEHGKNRLVMPAVAVKDPPPPPDPNNKNRDGNSGGGGGKEQLDLDPLLMALLLKIPKVSGNDSWPADKRLRWFRTFAMNVSEVYDADSAPVEFKIENVNGQGQTKPV